MAKMKSVQPQLQALKERYPDDKVKQQQEMMENLQEGEDQPDRRLSSRRLADSGVLLALQGAVRHHRNAPRAVLRLDQGLSAPDPTNLFNLFGLLAFDPTQVPLFGTTSRSASGRSSWASRCGSR
jgi:Preprotein translocase subunit YidC